MDPKRSGPSIMLAPPYGGGRAGTALSFPPADAPPRFPRVDEHVVVPERTRDELLRGRKVIAQPALEPHGDAHADLGAVVRLHVREGYRASIDLLTRVSDRSDFATDVSIRREGTEPSTGRRYLEEVSFEIVNEQSESVVRAKAEDLTERGVRRVFAIYVKRGTVCEWSRSKADFVPLDPEEVIEDACFVRPLRVRALLDGAVAESEAAQALARKGNPAIVAMKQLAELEGRRGVLRDALQARFGALPEAVTLRISTAEGEAISRWTKRLFTGSTIEDVLDETDAARR